VNLDVRAATAADAEAAAQLLHDFNVEYDEPTPEVPALAERVRALLAGGDTTVLLGGDGPDGIAVLRFRLAIWSEGNEAYLAELYVRPPMRGNGLGRALLEAAMDEARRRGADSIDLGTEEDDTAARALYESAGFTNFADGAQMLYYEREL
jgi:ribosomal protein S18 acetylase RimI-like enzyme